MKGSGILRILWPVTALLAASACGPADFETDEGTSTDQGALYFLSTKLWSPRNINVCFTTTGLDTEIGWVRAALKGQRSWDTEGNIILTGWGQCVTGETGIRILNSNTSTFTQALGSQGGNALIFLNMTSSAPVWSQVCIDHSLELEACIKTNAIHEFGHALGIAHEHERDDRPADCVENQGTPGDTKYGPWDAHSIMGYCTDAYDLSGFDRRGFDRMYGQADRDPPKLADVNGDNRADLLCHDVLSGRKWVDYANSSGTFAGSDWTTTAAWCNQNTARVYKGDFNGDNRVDLLCHDLVDGRKWINYASATGQYPGTGWSTTSAWCNHDRGQLFVGDFNGDGRDDLLCHDAANGTKWIDYADSAGRFLGTDWVRTATWCNNPDQRLSIGNFDGALGDDLLCHNIVTGTKWIDYANSVGQFGGTNWTRASNWCNQAGAQLLIGDFNGDGRDDMLCHDTVTGAKWIDYANTLGEFLGTDWQSTAAWCSNNTQRLFVGDVNGDNKDDLVCHDVSSGAKWVDHAGATGDFTGTNFSRPDDWCGQDSGEIH